MSRETRGLILARVQKSEKDWKPETENKGVKGSVFIDERVQKNLGAAQFIAY